MFPQVPSIDQLIFTVLSELGNSKFLADILAYCFPEAKQQKDEKFRKILSRLSSSISAEIGEPLSSHYHFQSKLMLESLKTVYRESNGKFHFDKHSEVDSEAGSETNKLSVGNFLFEQDVEYFRFLENVFSVIILPLQEEESGLSLYSPKSPSDAVDFHSIVSNGGSSSTTLYPIINKLIKWAQIPPPDMVASTEDGSRLSSTGGARKMARRRSKLVASSMKICLSAPVIISALKQIEEVHMAAENQNRHVKKTLDEGNVTEELNDSKPGIWRGLARDPQGQVHLLQVPEGVLQVG